MQKNKVYKYGGSRPQTAQSKFNKTFNQTLNDNSLRGLRGANNSQQQSFYNSKYYTRPKAQKQLENKFASTKHPQEKYFTSKNASNLLQSQRPLSSVSKPKEVSIQQCEAKKHLDNVMSEHEQYFNHLSGKCICTICTCGHCRCPFGQTDSASLVKKPFMNASWYSHCYQTPKSIKNVSLNPHLAHPHIKLFGPQQIDPTNYDSIYTESYRDKMGDKPDLVLPVNCQKVGEGPFMGKTSYQNQYQNWGKEYPDKEKHINQKTVLDLPFAGRSQYQQAYRGHPNPLDPNQLRILQISRTPIFQSPISPQFNFLHHTENQDVYSPKRNHDPNYKSSLSYKKNNIPQICSTTYTNDYKKKINKCPAREILNKYGYK